MCICDSYVTFLSDEWCTLHTSALIAYHDLLFGWVDRIDLYLRYRSARLIRSKDSTSSITSWYCTQQKLQC